MLLGACAQQHVITHVNQTPLFAPSQLGYAVRDGALPIEVHGALPAALPVDRLVTAVHLPGNYPNTKLVIYQASPDSVSPGKSDAGMSPGALCLQRIFDAGVTKHGNDCHGPSRLVLVFNPSGATHPDLACEAANSIATSASQEVRVLAAFCIGNRLASSGQVRIPESNGGSGNISSAINVLLMDMLIPRPGGGRESEHQRL
jgi:hypothetical protein